MTNRSGSSTDTPGCDPSIRAGLDAIPAIDFRSNFAVATAERGMAAMLQDVVRLRFGPGRLTSNEYYYYQLWRRDLSDEGRRSFVGKLAQHSMHMACNDIEWRAAAADKLLFASIMRGANLPTPELLAVVHPTRSLPGVVSLRDQTAVVELLRNPDAYPLFAKPIGGKYSLGIVSADMICGDTITLRGPTRTAGPRDVAEELTGRPEGFLIERRLKPAAAIDKAFGDKLWSVRMLVFLTPAGAVLHRATAKIPANGNPADNYWRAGNILGSLDRSSGRIKRAVTGSAQNLRVIESHPETGVRLIGIEIPGWSDTVELTLRAAALLPGIGTQSWDIAISADGPVIMEVNFGGDLNLTQLASGRGVLDADYRDHLARHGYKSVME